MGRVISVNRVWEPFYEDRILIWLYRPSLIMTRSVRYLKKKDCVLLNDWFRSFLYIFSRLSGYRFVSVVCGVHLTLEAWDGDATRIDRFFSDSMTSYLEQRIYCLFRLEICFFQVWACLYLINVGNQNKNIGLSRYKRVSVLIHSRWRRSWVPLPPFLLAFFYLVSIFLFHDIPRHHVIWILNIDMVFSVFVMAFGGYKPRF